MNIRLSYSSSIDFPIRICIDRLLTREREKVSQFFLPFFRAVSSRPIIYMSIISKAERRRGEAITNDRRRALKIVKTEANKKEGEEGEREIVRAPCSARRDF